MTQLGDDRDPVRRLGARAEQSVLRRQRERHPAPRGVHGRAAQGRRLAAARASTSWPHGVPVGLGEPLYDKLDADIAYAMMGINAVKGVEIGAGFARVAQRGTEHGDELTPRGLRQQQRRRRARRHLDRAGHHGVDRDQADRARSACRAARSTAPGSRRRSRRIGPPRPVRRHPRDADRRGDAGAGADGPCAAPARAVRRRARSRRRRSRAMRVHLSGGSRRPAGR